MSDKNITVERQEQIILEQVKFLDITLEEIRGRNKNMQEELGNSYAKLIGLGTPYEECIHSLRKVRGEFESYLKIVRSEIMARLNGSRGARL